MLSGPRIISRNMDGATFSDDFCQIAAMLFFLASRCKGAASGKILAGVSMARCKDAGTASFR